MFHIFNQNLFRMVTVYIWDFTGKESAWGHASMLCDDTYISWWPEGPRIPSITNPHIPAKFREKSDKIYTASPIRNAKFEDDQWREGNWKIKVPPNHHPVILGLDENAIKLWWASFGLVQGGHLLHGPLLPWHTLTQNCSTVVATALTIGGGAKYANWINTWNLVWRPNRVLEYAESIRRNIKS